MLQDLKQKGWSGATFLFAFFEGCALLSYLLIQAYDHEFFDMPLVVAFFRITIAIFGILIGKPWKDKGFILIFLLLLIQIIRLCIKDNNLLFTYIASESIINGLWVAAGCYLLGRILSVEQLEDFFRVLITIFLLGTMIHCSIALVNAWVDKKTINLSGKSYWGIRWGGRLRISYYYPNTAGSTLSISGLIALCALLTERNKIGKVFYAFASALIVITLSLTDSRTSFVSFAAGAGVLAGTAMFSMLHKQTQENKERRMIKKNRCLIIFASIIFMIAVTAVSFFIEMKIAPAFNAIRSENGIIIPTAKAEEEEEKRELANRGITGSNVLNGRNEVWGVVLQYLHDNPRTLLFGDSIYQPMAGPNQMMETSMGHCHNMVLQILLESGLVGLILVICFVFYTARNALRIINCKTLPLWLKLILAVPISMVVGDLAECFGWFAEWRLPTLAFAFIACGIINTVGSKADKDLREKVCK